MRRVLVLGEKPLPLPQFLRQRFPHLPPKILQNALKRRDVKRGGLRLGAHDLVAPGEELEIFIDESYLSGIPAPKVVFADENIVVAVKPQGVAVAEDSRGAPTLADALQGEYPGALPCHRLDVQTGGLTVFALNQPALAEMERAFKERSLQKIYRCLVFGRPSPGTALLRAWLSKDASSSKVAVYDRAVPGSLPIETAYQTLDSSSEMSLLKVDLLTGRTHQIRAHLAHIGHPVCGDDKYGDRAKNKAYGLTRQQLWATEIHLRFDDGPLKYLNGKAFSIKPEFGLRDLDR
ncbi:MAG: RluA family pseudouridine synthase [Christensenellaceae bacterium]|jgi:23S rRNA pseudouridine955/2504/2580 synthase|nr:RluA family pseudouridine synthase [Christensenellaceae bacterium]